MSVTDEELDKQRKELEKLREQVAETEAQRTEREQEQSRVLDMANMKAEEERLRAQLAAAREAAKLSSVRSGTAEQIDQAKDDAKAAQEQSDAQAKAEADAAAAAQADDKKGKN